MKNSPAPDRIYADRGPRGGWMYREERMPDTEATYIRIEHVHELRNALRAAANAMEAEAVVLRSAGLAKSCVEALERKALAARKVADA